MSLAVSQSLRASSCRLKLTRLQIASVLAHLVDAMAWVLGSVDRQDPLVIGLTTSKASHVTGPLDQST